MSESGSETTRPDGLLGLGPPLPRPARNAVGFWLGPALFLLILAFGDLGGRATAAAAVAVLMGVWWVTEAVPLAATSLLPLALFPLLGIMEGKKVATFYTDSNIVLFIGGFFIALSMERWNLHRRIALAVIRRMGGRPDRLVLGFMLATGGLSMWMSNTATAMMMTPMALSLVTLYEDARRRAEAAGEAVDPRSRNFPVALLLTIAYAASIGGFATLVGTPTNLVFVRIFKSEFADGPPISFARWAAFAVPLSLVLMVASWYAMCRFLLPQPKDTPFSGEEFLRAESEALGPMKREEATVLVVFALTALLWIFRSDIALGDSLTIPGWSGARWMPFGKFVDDGTVAIVMGLSLFALPGRSPEGRILDWATARKVPWGILLLFGGGFALAEGMSVSGLSAWLGGWCVALKGAPDWLVIVSVTLGVIALTEFASNMATVTMALPILASLARGIEVNPLLLMIPATIAASCGFMMPMGTTPNMIVYGTERLEMMDMVRTGFWLNLLAALLASFFVLTVAMPVFGVSPGEFPAWAATGGAVAPATGP